MSIARVANAVVINRRPEQTRSARSSAAPRLMPSHPSSRRLRSIVVPLDGADFSEHAIPLAIAIARRSGGVLKLVHVFMPADRTGASPRAMAFDVFESQLRLDAHEYLDNVRRRIAARMPELTVVTHLIESRNVSGTLGGLSADLVVMATHGRGWLGRLFLGSVAREVMSTRHDPTIYVRGYNAPVDFSADPVPLHVTVALDGRKTSERVLKAADMIAQVTGAESTFVQFGAADGHDRKSARGNSETPVPHRRRFAGTALGASTCVAPDAVSPIEKILSSVERLQGSLIVVSGRRGRQAWGSTAGSLLRRSRTPVLVVGEQ